VAGLRGQIQLMRELGSKVREAALRLEVKDKAANNLNQEGVVELLAGNKKEALEDARQAMKISGSPSVVMNAALIMALTGKEKDALKLADEVSSRRPYDTLVQFVAVPMVKAAVDMQKGDYAKVIDELDGAMVYARANTGVLYLRGMAFLRLGKYQEAAQAFQRVLDLQGFAMFDPVVPATHVGLARVYAAQGDKAHSRIEYQNFFGLWKDADAGLPLMRTAKVEYGEVQ